MLDVMRGIFILFHPAFIVGPTIFIILTAWIFKEKSIMLKMILSICIFIMLSIQIYESYLIWPLDLLPFREDIVLASVAVEEYTISLVQAPGITYCTYFLIQDAEGHEETCSVEPDSYKIWRVDISRNNEKIYFNMNGYNDPPYVDRRSMTIHNGDNGYERTLSGIFKHKRQ